MNLHEISRNGTTGLPASMNSELLDAVITATIDLYARLGFLQPWTGFVAVMDEVPVGTCGFAGPPEQGEVEIAYFTFPEFEGRGFATEMARQLLEIVRTAELAPAAIAHTLPQESASTSILRRHGFECLGVIEHPDDGPVWKWRHSKGCSAGNL